jgi:small redox-active disulfide protein 2
MIGEALVKKLQILGMGCVKCEMLAKHTDEAARSLGIEYSLEKVTNALEIAKLGVMATPALVVDGEVKVAGRVPTAEAIKTLLA